MNSIEYNILMDWKKLDVNPAERSKFILDLIKKEGKSQRQFARDYDIPQGTLSDWITMRHINKQPRANVNRDEILSLADRLLFLLSKKEMVTSKEFMKISEIHNEIGKKSILSG